MNDHVRLASEMNMYNWQIFSATLVIMTLMVAAILAARASGQEELLLLVLLLGVAWPFLMGRYDFLIHRIGIWFAQNGSAWEVSDVRLHKRWMLFFYDAGSALPVLVPFGYAVSRMWKLGYRKTVGVSVAAFALGIALFIYAPMAFNELRSAHPQN